MTSSLGDGDAALCRLLCLFAHRRKYGVAQVTAVVHTAQMRRPENHAPQRAARVHGSGQRRSAHGVFRQRDRAVPIPASAPSEDGSAWVSTRLANALVAAGLGATCWPGLQRTRSVRKSSGARPGARPSVAEHRLSLQVERSESPPRQILLIDDVVSRGRTLFAASLCVREAFPTAEIRAFALLRTLGLLPEIERLLDPCVGEIRWRHGDVHRNP